MRLAIAFAAVQLQVGAQDRQVRLPSPRVGGPARPAMRPVRVVVQVSVVRLEAGHDGRRPSAAVASAMVINCAGVGRGRGGGPAFTAARTASNTRETTGSKILRRPVTTATFRPVRPATGKPGSGKSGPAAR